MHDFNILIEVPRRKLLSYIVQYGTMDNSCRFIYFSLILMRVRISNALTANGCRLPRHMPVCLEPVQNQECFPNQHTKYHGSRQVSRWKPLFSKESWLGGPGFDFTPEGCCFPLSTDGIMEWWKDGILGMKSGWCLILPLMRAVCI